MYSNPGSVWEEKPASGTIDKNGIQPGYYIDKNIPPYKWIDFVIAILNQQ
jgi:hypothetical protein